MKQSVKEVAAGDPVARLVRCRDLTEDSMNMQPYPPRRPGEE